MLACVFEQFTERAHQVVVLAQEEARILKHNYIGTEHILLGLLREEEGIAARVLGRLDITVEPVRAQVARIVGSGDEVTPGQIIPFTPRAKEVLELALREALSLGHNYIGAEHILLGLVRENAGVATRILLDLDADAEKVRNEVIRMLAGPGGRRTLRRPTSSDPSPRPLSYVEADEGVSRLMETVATGIAQHLGRPVDAGDLLVAFASVPDGLVARTLTALGIEAAALDAAVAEARRQPTPAGLARLVELDGEIEAVRAQQRANTTASNELRALEGKLVDQARKLDDHRLNDALTALRNRLELPDS